MKIKKKKTKTKTKQKKHRVNYLSLLCAAVLQAHTPGMFKQFIFHWRTESEPSPIYKYHYRATTPIFFGLLSYTGRPYFALTISTR